MPQPSRMKLRRVPVIAVRSASRRTATTRPNSTRVVQSHGVHMASRFAWQLGQTYRHLQGNASRYSCVQASQRMRAKPCRARCRRGTCRPRRRPPDAAGRTRARSGRRTRSAGAAAGPTPPERAARPAGVGACRRHAPPGPRRACAPRGPGSAEHTPDSGADHHRAAARRAVSTQGPRDAAERCLLQSGVVGSALRAPRIGAPAAEANVEAVG